MTEKESLLQHVGEQSYGVSSTVCDLEERPFTGTVRGLTVAICALFIVAEMAGSGVLALPRAVGEGGWTGLGLLIFCCFLSLYSGIILGQCWTIIRKNNREYQGHVRDPYSIIGLVAAGKPGKYIVEICVLVTLFGVCTVFLLLASHQISSLIDIKIGSFSTKNEFRMWVLVCGVCLIPFTWLATPKDMWPFAIAASMCTLVACVLMVIRTAMYLAIYGIAPNSSRNKVTVKSFFDAFGTIAFSFGGAALIPTFQTDMKVPKDFPKAASLAFISVLLMYIPVTLLPYLAFGSNIDSNILVTLKNARGNGEALITAAEALITFHLLFTFIITINPIGQQIEVYLKMKHEFGWKRILLRTGLVVFVIAIAEAIPNFSPILSFIGGSTVTMMAFILPCWFYLRLQDHIPLYIKVLHVEIIVVALISGGTATYSAATGFTNPFKA